MKFHIERELQHIKGLKTSLVLAIEQFPENHRIQMLGSRCFLLDFSQLNHNWSPEYHCFESQKQWLIDIVENARIESLIGIFETILDTGSHRHQGNTRKFHPDIVKQLAELMGLEETEWMRRNVVAEQ